MNSTLRRMVRETSVSVDDLIYPLFIKEGRSVKEPIDAMPGQFRYSPDQLSGAVREAVSRKIPAVLLFGIPGKKDKFGTGAHKSDGVVQQAVKRIKDLAPDLLAGVTPTDLRDAFARALTPKPVPRVELDHVAPSRMSVTEAVAELIDELPRLGRISFRALTDTFVERLEVVVRFLAVLELFKQGMIDLDQPTSFGELTISWIGGDADDDDRSVLADLVGSIDVYEG